MTANLPCFQHDLHSTQARTYWAIRLYTDSAMFRAAEGLQRALTLLDRFAAEEAG
jgi:hypothetical protein